MTAPVSPERALYEADPWKLGIHWEEVFPEDKAKYRRMAQAAIRASPELTEAREQLAAVKEIATEGARGVVSGRRFATAGAAALLSRRILAVLGDPTIPEEHKPDE